MYAETLAPPPLLLAACIGSDTETTEPAEQQTDSQLATLTPECIDDPCKDVGVLLPVTVDITIKANSESIEVGLPENTTSLDFELIGAQPVPPGGEIKMRVTIKECPHDASFQFDVEAEVQSEEPPDGEEFDEDKDGVHTYEIKFKNSPEPEPKFEAPRTIEVTATDIERVSGVDAGFFDVDYPATGLAPLLLVAGFSEISIVNLSTDQEIEKLSTPFGRTYGAVAYSAGSKKMIVATGEWGAAAWQYVAGSFVMVDGAAFVTGNVTDIVICPPTGRIVVANNSAGELQTYDLLDGKYQKQDSFTISLEGVVSVEKLPDGEFMATSEDSAGQGTAWWIPEGEFPKKVMDLGDFPRIITASPNGQFAVIPCLGDGISFPQVFFLTRADPDSDWEAPLSLLAIEAVSIGIKQLANGNYKVAIPSGRTDEVRTLEMEPDATVVDEKNEDLAEGAEDPNHSFTYGNSIYTSCAGSIIDCRAIPESD